MRGRKWLTVVLVTAGILLVIYAVSLFAVFARRGELAVSGILHSVVVSALGAWMAAGSWRDLRKPSSQPWTVWDRWAAALLICVVVFGGAGWLASVLGAPRAFLVVLAVPFTLAFFGAFGLLAAYLLNAASK
jgi:hypothetical protein